MQEFISKIQYLIGELGFKFLSSTQQSYSSITFQKLLELDLILQYFTSADIVNETQQSLDILMDFVEARYNLNPIPYIQYPNRVTNILYGFGVSSQNNTFIFSGVDEAPSDGSLYARRNKTWQSFTLPVVYTQSESDTRYYPLNTNPSNYLTIETDPTVPSHVKSITSLEKANWNLSYSWGNHALAGYALSGDLHNPVTLGTANGLSLIGQQLSLALSTSSTNGAMSAADKTKLDSIIVHDAITLGTTNGLSLSGQEISLSLATVSQAGAMSSADKIKLNSLSNYTHPTGFLNKPLVPLTGNTVISQILITPEGHVSDIVTRELNLNTVGVTPGELAVVNDTNVELSLTGTPATALLQDVTITVNWAGNLPVIRGGTGITNLTAGEVLIGNGTNAISTISRSGIDTRTSFPAATHNLTSHSDVTISSPSTDQVLMYNGTTWINSTLNLSNITFTETDPIFTAFQDTVRTNNTIYAGPSVGSGVASFRSLTTSDIPNAYVRFDITQTLTATQKQRVRTAIGAQASGAYELAFTKGNITTATPTVFSLTNATGRLVGTSDFIINHSTSGWLAKTALTGAFVISNLSVDDYGHIADWTTRELTLADLGFVAFDPSTIEATLSDHESRITTLETNFPLLNGDKNYVHVQAAPATVWTFTHNLGKKPSVTIIDSAGSMIFAKLTYIDNNNIEIDFNGSATSGEAICN